MRRRDYAGGADLTAMQRAVQQTWCPGRWHIGDLAWRRHSVPVREPGWRTALWERPDGSTAAWGWVHLPGHLDWYVDPGSPGPAGAVLDFFDEVSADGPRTVTVTTADDHLTAVLRRRGYRPAPDGTPYFRHHVVDLGTLRPPPPLPSGYHVRAVRPGEAAARAAAHRAAWHSTRIGDLWDPPADLGDAPSRVTADSYGAVMATWPYRHDLDLVVEAPDATIAACALGWLDDVHAVGLLEPVGTDPRHGRRGLGAAVSMACLHALRRAGARRAVVCPRGDAAYPVPGRLYRRLGFRPIGRTLTYVR